MKTRNRILFISQDLFNHRGEPNVSTVDIATEMDISPGNLYYHFRNKEEIITSLFHEYEEHMGQALAATELSLVSPIECLMHIKLLFEIIWNYRFIHRDLNNILSKNKSLHRRFKHILNLKRETFSFILDIGEEREYLKLPKQHRSLILNNLLISTTFSYNFYPLISQPSNQGIKIEDFNQKTIHYAMQQVISLILPYLPSDYQNQCLEIIFDLDQS